MNAIHPDVIRLAIAEDHTIVREALCGLLTALGNFEIDVEASNGKELIRQLKGKKTLPDVCLLDINMPELNGYETLKQIRLLWPHMRCVILTMHDSEYTILQMLRSGANGYLLKECTAEELKKALVTVHNKGYYHSELISNNIYYSLLNEKLTPKINGKEMQFLSYCCTEKSYKEIANIMAVSVRTVEGYRDSLFEKLHLKSRIGLAMYAIDIGIVTNVRI